MSSPRPSNVVLTGACGGLGQALARELLAAGSKVALVGLQRETLEALATLAPERSAIYLLDVSDSAAVNAMAADWCARFGTPDAVIANAGVAGGYLTEAAEDLAVMRRMLEINLLGVATTFQPFVAPMRAAGRGSLVGIASLAGWRGLPGNGAYCASKAGLIAYLQSLRAELRADGLQVLTVHPGYIRTALTAGNRFTMPALLEPQDAARRIVAAVRAGREQLVMPRRLGWLSRLLSLLPARWHDRLLGGQPRKPRAGEAGATPIPGLTPPAAPGAQPHSAEHESKARP
ncbi:SDR family oxidoreductase [Rivibacter subsaxonicus]|uniref:Short-subunit dehydrogenase n=1 Tax=Rivibacter subsaxonicus TaxID=457575 RepID=A0A4Q7VMR7_9BURK|nr:SDR family oxidoreductase [Rivibacter subsaxonicus]RZT97621.1 hypothetical protein EV670_2012 [Rivibacter subsaxonicus]